MLFQFSIQRENLLGAILALAIFWMTIGTFVARLADKPRLEYGLGFLLILLTLPLAYLLVSAFSLDRPRIYFLWIGLMIIFLLVELLLDYVWSVQFREVRWQVVLYVVLFFGSTGGMIGVAGLAGRGWSVAAVVSFLLMAALAFFQRHVTGL
ncbi:hypothetical protein ACFL3S_11615 [Gemmatimonadota bacterium]